MPLTNDCYRAKGHFLQPPPGPHWDQFLCSAIPETASGQSNGECSNRILATSTVSASQTPDKPTSASINWSKRKHTEQLIAQEAAEPQKGFDARVPSNTMRSSLFDRFMARAKSEFFEFIDDTSTLAILVTFAFVFRAICGHFEGAIMNAYLRMNNSLASKSYSILSESSAAFLIRLGMRFHPFAGTACVLLTIWFSLLWFEPTLCCILGLFQSTFGSSRYSRSSSPSCYLSY